MLSSDRSKLRVTARAASLLMAPKASGQSTITNELHSYSILTIFNPFNPQSSSITHLGDHGSHFFVELIDERDGAGEENLGGGVGEVGGEEVGGVMVVVWR